MINNVHHTGQVVVIDLSGTLDVAHQVKFKEALVKEIPPDKPQVVLNFKGVDFIDSSCLGALIAIARTVREKGGDVKLASLNSEVTSVFQITRLDKIFPIFEKTEEAVTSF